MSVKPALSGSSSSFCAQSNAKLMARVKGDEANPVGQAK
jgi:hypothetical protein